MEANNLIITLLSGLIAGICALYKKTVKLQQDERQCQIKLAALREELAAHRREMSLLLKENRGDLQELRRQLGAERRQRPREKETEDGGTPS